MKMGAIQAGRRDDDARGHRIEIDKGEGGGRGRTVEGAAGGDRTAQLLIGEPHARRLVKAA